MERTAVRGRLTWQTAAVTSVTRETASVVTIQLDPPDWPGHRAGQHLEARLTADDGYQAERDQHVTRTVHVDVGRAAERVYVDGPAGPGVHVDGPAARRLHVMAG